MNMFARLSQFFPVAHDSNVLWKAFCNHADNYYGDQICTTSQSDKTK